MSLQKQEGKRKKSKARGTNKVIKEININQATRPSKPEPNYA